LFGAGFPFLCPSIDALLYVFGFFLSSPSCKLVLQSIFCKFLPWMGTVSVLLLLSLFVSFPPQCFFTCPSRPTAPALYYLQFSPFTCLPYTCLLSIHPSSLWQTALCILIPGLIVYCRLYVTLPIPHFVFIFELVFNLLFLSQFLSELSETWNMILLVCYLGAPNSTSPKYIYLKMVFHTSRVDYQGGQKVHFQIDLFMTCTVGSTKITYK
jgi:hypothetical protein